MADAEEIFELFMNELQADMQINQLVLQHMIGDTLLNIPDPQTTLRVLENQIRGSIENSSNVSDDAQDGERLKHLILARADRFFQPLKRRFGVPDEKPRSGNLN